MLKQARLTNSWLTPNNDRRTKSGANLADQGIEPNALALPPNQHAVNVIRELAVGLFDK